MKNTIIIAAFIVAAIGGAYLLCVLGVWLLTLLLGAAFHTTFDVNVWLLGLALWVVLGIIKLIIK